MIELSGIESFAEAPVQVWRRLSDLSFLANAIPSLSSITEATDDRLTCKVKPALSFLTGSLSTTITIQDRRDPDRLVILIRSKGIGSQATVRTVFDLADAQGGTNVTWTASINDLGGLLKPIGTDLIEASAGKVIASAWEGFREKLTERG